jgi:hypothetical protein
MIGLRTFEGDAFDVFPDATLSIEQNNPLLADSDNNGAYALPFTIPRSPANQRILDFPELLDNARGQARSLERVDVFDAGRHLLSGTLRLLRITSTSYELTLSYGASAVMTKLKAVKLRALTLGGVRVVGSGPNFFNNKLPLIQHMNAVVANPEAYDYVFAPFSNNDALDDNPDGWPERPNFNYWDNTAYTGGVPGGFIVDTGYRSSTLVGGLQVSPFPDFYPFYKYNASPAVKLPYLVRTMFAELGIPLEEDIFDAEISKLVVVCNAVADDNLITSRDEALALGLTDTDYWFRLPDLLPDMTCQEFIRAFADTFFLDISVSPTGVLRLRRSNQLLRQPPAMSLTRAASPGFDVDVSADRVQVVTAYRSENDSYASDHYQTVDPNQLGPPIAKFDDLPALPHFAHEIRLVQEENAYYQHTDTEWQFYSEKLDTPTFGPASESVTTVTQGCELLLELNSIVGLGMPLPGQSWPPSGTQPVGPVQRIPCFGERAYAPAFNCLERSKALRLAFYRGLQPYQTASDGKYPMLSTGNLNLQNQVLGPYSLRLDGEAGTVAQFGTDVLQLKTNPDTVTWPIWLDEEQFYQLDMARRVEIDGLHFVVKKIALTFPIQQPAQLDLVLVTPGVKL